VVWSWTFILASSLGPRIFVSVSSASVSSNSSSNVSFLNLLERCLDSVLVSRVSCSIGVITKETISSWWRHQNFPTRLLKHGNGNADDPQPRWIQAFIIKSRALFKFGWFGYPSPPSYTNYLPGWLQAAGKGWLGIQRNKKTLQPYESGIDGAIRQWLARVVLPRVLRFPPTKRFNTKEMVLLRVLRFPSTKRIR